MGGLAGGTKLMGVLAPALLGVVVCATALGRGGIAPALRATVGFGLVAMLVASPCYLRNAAATGNPIFPFGYGVFGGSNWSAEAARGLDDYYAAYRETHAQKRGAGAYGSWLEALRFPWDATMARMPSRRSGASRTTSARSCSRSCPPRCCSVAIRRMWIIARRSRLVYSAIVVFGMWAHPRYIHPALPLFLIGRRPGAAGRSAASPWARRAVVGVLALTGRSAGADRAPAWWRRSCPTAARRDRAHVGGRVPPPLRAPLSALGARQSRGAAGRQRPHPRDDPSPVPRARDPSPSRVRSSRGRSTIASSRPSTSSTAALAPFGVTHVVREPEDEKAAANPVGERVTRLWDELIARSEKVGESKGGALYRLRPPSRAPPRRRRQRAAHEARAQRQHAARHRRPRSGRGSCWWCSASRAASSPRVSSARTTAGSSRC